MSAHLIRYLETLRASFETHRIGHVEIEVVSVHPTEIIVTVYSIARRKEMASILFANNHAVIVARSDRCAEAFDIPLDTPQLVRPLEACRHLRSYYEKTLKERAAVLSIANIIKTERETA